VEWLCESYELDIANLIIKYSICHNIKIPLINYDLYRKVREDSVEEVENIKTFKRKKVDDPNNEEDEGEKEYLY